MELTAQRLPKPPQQTTLLNSFSLSCSPLGRCESGQLSLIHPVTRKRLVAASSLIHAPERTICDSVPVVSRYPRIIAAILGAAICRSISYAQIGRRKYHLVFRTRSSLRVFPLGWDHLRLNGCQVGLGVNDQPNGIRMVKFSVAACTGREVFHRANGSHALRQLSTNSSRSSNSLTR